MMKTRGRGGGGQGSSQGARAPLKKKPLARADLASPSLVHEPSPQCHFKHARDPISFTTDSPLNNPRSRCAETPARPNRLRVFCVGPTKQLALPNRRRAPYAPICGRAGPVRRLGSRWWTPRQIDAASGARRARLAACEGEGSGGGESLLSSACVCTATQRDLRALPLAPGAVRSRPPGACGPGPRTLRDPGYTGRTRGR